MRIETDIKKWGNSLALRVSGLMATVPNFSAGDPVIVEVSETGLVVKPLQTKPGPLKFTEAELIEGLSPYTAHADELPQLTEAELGVWQADT